MRSGLGLLCCVSLLGFDTRAQPQFATRHLDHDTGLAHDRFNAFFGTDARGFHYIGTTQGPYRFDGQTLRHLPPAGAPAASAQVLSDLYRDRRGALWYSTAEALVRYDPASGRADIRALAPGQPATVGYHLFDYDAAADALYVSNSEYVYRVEAARPAALTPLTTTEGVRYLGLGAGGGARRYLGLPWLLRPGLERLCLADDGTSATEYTTDARLLRMVISAGERDHRGGVWLASDSGLLAYDPHRDRLLERIHVPAEPGGRIWDVARYDTLLLVASEAAGTWLFDPVRRRFLHRVSAPLKGKSAPTDRPRALHVAPGGQVFVMCDPTGVDVMVPLAASVHVPTDERGEALRAEALAVDRRGQTWVLERTGAVALIDAAGAYAGRALPKSKIPAGKGEALTTPAAFATDRAGTLWLAHGRYLFHNPSLTLGGWTPYREAPEPVLSIFTAQTGGLYVLTRDRLYALRSRELQPVRGWRHGGSLLVYLKALDGDRFALIDDDAWLRILTLDGATATYTDSLRVPTEVLDVGYDASSAELFVGTMAGLYRVRSAGGLAGSALSLEIAEQSIAALGFDRDHRLWVSTDRGLGFRQNGQWTFLTEDHGLPDNAGVEQLLVPDGAGRVWASMTEALVRVAAPPAGAPASSGALYLKRAWIDERLVARGADDLARGFDLGHTERSLQLEVGTARIYDAAAPRVEYRLAGVHADWQPGEAGGVIRLANLAPDRYRLELRAVAADGRATPVVRVPVAVAGPYWETWWFRGLVALGLSGLAAVGAYAFYRRKLVAERREFQRREVLRAERDRIARELHDELGSGLATILFLTEDAEQAVSPAERDRIAELSKDSLASLRDIIWALDERDTGLRDLVTKVSAMVTQQCADRRLACDVSGVEALDGGGGGDGDGGDEGGYKVPATVRRNVYLIVKEAVSNAVRHAGARQLRVAFAKSPAGALVVEVRDDGGGFAETHTTRGMGLDNLRRRATEIGGHVNVSSAPGAGTTVTLTLPATVIGAPQA